MPGRNIHELLTHAWRYPNRSPGERLTLIVLIEHMGDHDGEWCCWPGTKLLASETLQSEGTVRRHLSAMEGDGLLSTRRRPRASGRGSLVNEIVLHFDVLTNQSLCADGPDDQPRTEETTNRASGPIAPITELPDEPGVASLPLASLPSAITKTARAMADQERVDAMAAFEQWWRAYPRRDDKGAARKAYMAALRRGASPRRMLAAAEAYARDPRRKPEFTKLPATWLTAEAYDNEPATPGPAVAPVAFGPGVASFVR